MSPLYLHNNKLLVKDGKLAVNNSCCCSACGCKFSSGSTTYIASTSGDGTMGGNGNPCTITAAGMNARGVIANQFVQSQIGPALEEVEAWLKTLGWCANAFCSCCDYTYPESLTEEDPLWFFDWPCKYEAIARPENIDNLRVIWPDIQLGQCYLFRMGMDPSASICDTDNPCPHCCTVFAEPFAYIEASCCNSCGQLGDLVNFVGTIDITLPYDGAFPIGGATSVSDQKCNPAPPATNCRCSANTPYPDGGFSLGYVNTGENTYRMTATARVCGFPTITPCECTMFFDRLRLLVLDCDTNTVQDKTIEALNSLKINYANHDMINNGATCGQPSCAGRNLGYHYQCQIFRKDNTVSWCGNDCECDKEFVNLPNPWWRNDPVPGPGCTIPPNRNDVFDGLFGNSVNITPFTGFYSLSWKPGYPEAFDGKPWYICRDFGGSVGSYVTSDCNVDYGCGCAGNCVPASCINPCNCVNGDCIDSRNPLP